MYDIHSHILPGVDDGAQSLEEAIAMAELAVRSGVQCMAVTPHSNQKGRYENYDSLPILDNYDTLRQALREEGIPLKLVRGMEIFADGELSWKIASGQVIPLNNSRYYLIEFNFGEAEWFITETIEGVCKLGKVPVIAHPERYGCVQHRPELVWHWRSMGALAQLNKGSPLGMFGAGPQACAQTLLEHGLVNCIASDAHSPRSRTPDMTRLADWLHQRFPGEYCRLLLHTNPKRILNDRTLDNQPAPLRPEPERRWF